MILNLNSFGKFPNKNNYPTTVYYKISYDLGRTIYVKYIHAIVQKEIVDIEKVKHDFSSAKAGILEAIRPLQLWY